MVSVVKNPPANTGDIRDAGSIPGSEEPLKNPMYRGAWQATVHGVAKETQLKRLNTT